MLGLKSSRKRGVGDEDGEYEYIVCARDQTKTQQGKGIRGKNTICVIDGKKKQSWNSGIAENEEVKRRDRLMTVGLLFEKCAPQSKVTDAAMEEF